MRSLRKGEVVRFSSMDDFTGTEMQLIGTIIGDYLDIRFRYPKEMGSAEEGLYLVRVSQKSGLFVINRDEVLESFGINKEVL